MPQRRGYHPAVSDMPERSDVEPLPKIPLLLEAFLRGLGQLVASADELHAEPVFRWGGWLLLGLSACDLPLILVYALRGLDWASLIPNGLLTLVLGLLALGFARLIGYRRRLRAEDGAQAV